MITITPQLSQRMTRQEIANLQEVLIFLGYNLASAEANSQSFGASTSKALREFQEAHGLEATGIIDKVTAAKLNRLIYENLQPLPVDPGSTSSNTENLYKIHGTVFQTNGRLAKELKLLFYRIGFQGVSEMGDTETDQDGFYEFIYDSGADTVNFEIKAIDKNTGKPIQLLKPYFNAASVEEINLVAPALPIEAEYKRMTGDLKAIMGAGYNLENIKEDEERRDISMFVNATGWDARLITLAVISEKLSTEFGRILSTEGIYGLLRVGWPSDKSHFAEQDPGMIKDSLKAMQEIGIISISSSEIDTFAGKFSELRNGVRLKRPLNLSNAPYDLLMKASGLEQPALDKFMAIHLEHQGSTDELWKKARAKLSANQISRLQLFSKYAFLSANSVNMTKCLIDKNLDNPIELVDKEFYNPAIWVKEIYQLAGLVHNDRPNHKIPFCEIPTHLNELLRDLDSIDLATKEKLNEIIPASYDAEDLAERVRAYAEDMALKIKSSYPTAVLCKQIELEDHYATIVSRETLTLLKEAAAEGFELGRTPIGDFKNRMQLKEKDLYADVDAALQEIAFLRRMKQVSPANECIPILASIGADSSAGIIATPKESFLHDFNSKYENTLKIQPRSGLAESIYDKAVKISGIAFSALSMLLGMVSGPAMSCMSSQEDIGNALNNLSHSYPNMEQLFGSLDYYDCEHSRSVLSPAAYFVDLLQFLEKKKTGKETADQKSPYDYLIERRPDLPRLELSSENTEVAMPYIDLVNEILEFYVAYGSLDEGAVRNTGEETTGELLAEPQNILVEAYNILSAAKYPLGLPFDLAVETAREFCKHFGMPLTQLQDVFRQNDERLSLKDQLVEALPRFMERLGITMNEMDIFTNPSINTIKLYGYDNTNEYDKLKFAKILSRRLNITYNELVQIVQTRFVNPFIFKLDILNKMGASISSARIYNDYKGLLSKNPLTLSAAEKELYDEAKAFLDKFLKLNAIYNVCVKEFDKAINSICLSPILVLADSDTSGNFDKTELRYSNGRVMDDSVFLRINLFVRLWRKLGWSIEDTDMALKTFITEKAASTNENPTNMASTDDNFREKRLFTALIYLSHFKTLEEMLKSGKQNRRKLMTFWSDIDTIGRKSLYSELFLTSSLRKGTTIFDHPLCKYLEGGHTFKDNLLPVQEALGLTAEDINAIWSDANPDRPIEEAELSIANLSLLYRYGILSKWLKLKLPDMITLKRLSGINPFATLDREPLTSIENDYPLNMTLEFVKLVDEIRNSGFTIQQLNYLLRHQYENIDKQAAEESETVSMVKSLAENIRMIRASHIIPDNAGALSDSILNQKLALSLPSDIAAIFISMMNRTYEYHACSDGIEPCDQLFPDDFKQEKAITILPYNNTRKTQEIICRGVMSEAEHNAIKTRSEKLLRFTPGQKNTLNNLLDLIYKISMEQSKEFFDKYLLKQTAVQPKFGFLEKEDYSFLFTAPESDDLELQLQMDNKRRMRLAQAFFPALQDSLIRQLVVQTATARITAAPSLIESLLTDGQLLAMGEKEPLISFLNMVDQQGVCVTYTTAGKIPVSKVIANADTSLLPLDDADEICFDSYFEVQRPGAYRFTVEMTDFVTFKLNFPHLEEPLFLKNTEGKLVYGEGFNDYLELKPGILYKFNLKIEKPGATRVRMFVQGETMPKGELSQLTLYPAGVVDRAKQAVTRLMKTLQLLTGLRLNEAEMRYIQDSADDFDSISLSGWPVDPADETATDIKVINKNFGNFRRMAAYSKLKNELAGGTDDIIAIFKASGERKCQQIAKLTNFSETVVEETAKALYDDPSIGFTNEKHILRLWNALKAAGRFGVSASVLKRWTDAVKDSGNTVRDGGKPVPDIAGGIIQAIKSRYEPENWRNIAQPIFDTLRKRRRDALVAYITHKGGFENAEKLFEHFLIDSGMEPVVQTSRLRLAISSVQLFIQRCLINLEAPDVKPSDIAEAELWPLLKKYRVWEANRKIFLYPENWLDPEFRDEKSYMYEELESVLLQDDVSADMVESAFGKYLEQLNEISRLDIVAMYQEEKKGTFYDYIDNNKFDQPYEYTTQCVLHVFGRTFSMPYKYYYRRYEYGMWTPWEPLNIEIQGDHLAPVVWQGRLYLFWATFNIMEEAEQSSEEAPLNEMTFKKLSKTLMGTLGNYTVDVRISWSVYSNEGWSAPEMTDNLHLLKKPTKLGENFTSSHDIFIYLNKKDPPEDGLYICFQHRAFAAHVYFKNKRSKPVANNDWINGEIGKPRPRPDAPMVPWTNIDISNSKGGVYLGAMLHLGNDTKYKNEQKTLYLSLRRKGNEDISFNILKSNYDHKILISDCVLAREEPWAWTTTVWMTSDFVEDVDVLSCLKPFFYMDDNHTFFVAPSLKSLVIDMADPPGLNDLSFEKPWSDPGKLKEWVAAYVHPCDPKSAAYERASIISQPGNIYAISAKNDWVVNNLTAIKYNDSLIGSTGFTDVFNGPAANIIKERGFTTEAAHNVAGNTINANVQVNNINVRQGGKK